MKTDYPSPFRFAVFLLFAFCSLACISAATPAETLVSRLQKLTKKGLMYGHQDDPFYGISWRYEAGRSDTRDLVGDYPAVMGFELGGIEMANERNLDGVPFDLMRSEIQAQHRRGGFVTISWHPRNPLLGTTAWIESDLRAYRQVEQGLRALRQESLIAEVPDPRATVRSVLPGGSAYYVFQTWLQRVTDFLVSLTDDKGRPIPLMFRPWHENNGSWFWWGQSLCSDEEYHSLWNLTQDYIGHRLPETIVWAFSPNVAGNWTEEEWMKRYPGDERVDLIGIDAYQGGSEEDFVRNLSADLDLVSRICEKHGKVLALTECGYQNSPDATWWTRVFRPVVSKYPVSYFLPWRNEQRAHFGPAPETATAEDFKAWAKRGDLLFSKDVR